MPEVLTKDSTLKCGATPHNGTITVNPTAKLRVDNARVLTKADVVNASIAGCTVSSSTISPCATVNQVATQESTKLTVNGQPVLVGLTGKTDPTNSTGTLFAQAGQTKLKAT